MPNVIARAALIRALVVTDMVILGHAQPWPIAHLCFPGAKVGTVPPQGRQRYIPRRIHHSVNRSTIRVYAACQVIEVLHGLTPSYWLAMTLNGPKQAISAVSL